MSNIKDPSKRRVAISATISPEAAEYVAKKANRFCRGKSGGKARALDEIILLVKRLEPKLTELMEEEK